MLIDQYQLTGMLTDVKNMEFSKENSDNPNPELNMQSIDLYQEFVTLSGEKFVAIP